MGPVSLLGAPKATVTRDGDTRKPLTLASNALSLSSVKNLWAVFILNTLAVRSCNTPRSDRKNSSKGHVSSWCTVGYLASKSATHLTLFSFLQCQHSTFHPSIILIIKVSQQLPILFLCIDFQQIGRQRRMTC